jgi:hypothetical protein
MLAMQDNSGEFIYEREERSDQLIPKKEEQDEEREWDPKSEEIEGIEPKQNDVMP